jgi:hypothetical protein
LRKIEIVVHVLEWKTIDVQKVHTYSEGEPWLVARVMRFMSSFVMSIHFGCMVYMIEVSVIISLHDLVFSLHTRLTVVPLLCVAVTGRTHPLLCIQ